eukprot:CAMPEP_0174736770 /NCGR_PEP_ID=MMETSP1094-20130205/67225_1 /TAXON_ID=156173 /ORGANISM="Chrysochromulina brevifilum, Strain UTEX LB 985" /LENGTH=115 /DNA_ID=CAMNT_0015939917 /DNA_START=210 /DNA_END=557 /DNA_ORIENTATION=-
MPLAICNLQLLVSNTSQKACISLLYLLRALVVQPARHLDQGMAEEADEDADRVEVDDRVADRVREGPEFRLVYLVCAVGETANGHDAYDHGDRVPLSDCPQRQPDIATDREASSI